MKKKWILIAAFKHETNSFCPAPANREAFENRQMYFGEDVKAQLGHVENEIGAFYQVLGGEEDMELVPCFALNAAPSGPVTADVYDLATKLLCDSVLQQGPFDGTCFRFTGPWWPRGILTGRAISSKHSAVSRGRMFRSSRRWIFMPT